MLSTTTKSYTRRDKKSRVGCRTCKVKRIRCDETRPGCINCVRKGRVCPGYQVSLSWSTKHEHHNPKLSQRGSGPVDFEVLASNASQAIHQGLSYARDTNPGSYLSAALAPSHPNTPQSLQSAQAGANLTKPPAPNRGFEEHHPQEVTASTRQYHVQCLQEPPMPPTGYHSPALTAESPTITHTEPRGTTRYIVDSGSQTSAAVTDIGWVSDGECPQGLNSPAVTERSTNHINQTMILAAPTMGLVDLPTSLVQHWFGSVCCYWSAFDSESNPFRSVAASLWGSSRVVFYSLQSMSAAALVEYMPNMKEITSSAPALAIEAISEELAELYTSDPGVVQFPKGLILALFCMGSSMCWDDPQRTGAHFFRQAKRLLRHFERRSESLSEGDRQLLDFFGGCMKYEEMLRDVAGERERENLPRASLGENRERQVSIKPHAWTGVSPDLLGLFGDAISLCRQECVRRQGHNNVTRESLRDALDAIDEAQALEEALLVVEPASLQPEDVHCADTMRWAHLRNTTEGYRLASLLQLYQTFPDLIARRIPGQIGADGLVPNSTWLVPLALHLTAILQRTPPSSDLRCIQPLLYLSAGSCLRYDEMTASSVRMGCTSGDIMGLLAGNTPESLPSLFAATPGISDEEAMFEDLGVSSARKLIMERLGELEHVLPPKPIRVAQQLMKATWHVFDSEVYAPRKTHWLDIMASTGLKTLFG